MQNPFETRAGGNSVVDKLIGNAFEVVKYVAYYIKEIQYVAFNMEHVHRVSTGMYENVLKEYTILVVNDTPIAIDLPEGISPLMILNTGVNVVTVDGDIYGASDSTFSWVITGNQLVVTLADGAPESFVNAKLRWLINWQSPVVVTE